MNDHRYPVSTAGGRYPAWRRDSRELFFVTPDGRINAVAIGPGPSFSASALKVVVSEPMVQTQTVMRSYDVTADGTRFLVIQGSGGADTRPPLTLVLNFAEELKRLARR